MKFVQSVAFASLFFIFFLSVTSVHALIIDPGRIIQGYNPEVSNYNYSFSLLNDGDEDVIIIPTFEGVFKDSMKGSEERFLISGRKSTKYFVSVHVPGPLAPGRHESHVRFFQLPRESSGVGATIAIRVGVFFDVPPYPKYIIPTILPIAPVAPGSEVVIPLRIEHVGTDVINNAEGTLVIGTTPAQKSSAFSLSLLIPQDVRFFNVTVPSRDWLPGIYGAQLVVDYDGLSTNTSQYQFVIGAKAFSFTSFSPSSASIGVIPISFSIKNLWGTKVSPAVTLSVLRDGKIIRQQDLGKYDIEALSEKNISQYLNVADLSPGKYTIQLHATDAEVTAQKEFDLLLVKATELNSSTVPSEQVSKEKMSFSYTQVILVVLLLVLVFAGIGMWYKNRTT